VVYRRSDGRWRGEVLQAGRREAREEPGPTELRSPQPINEVMKQTVSYEETKYKKEKRENKDGTLETGVRLRHAKATGYITLC
jgi:hypothetical protein